MEIRVGPRASPPRVRLRPAEEEEEPKIPPPPSFLTHDEGDVRNHDDDEAKRKVRK